MAVKNKNPIIEEARDRKRMYSYELARLLGVSETTMYRMLRNPLPKAEQERIAKMIEDYNKGAENDRS